MAGKLNRMRALGCDGTMGKAPEATNGRAPYRFPHCSVFLRPTDSLQHLNAKLVFSGLNIPPCGADVSWVENNRGGKSIRRATVRGQSVSHRMSEDLFNSSFIRLAKLSVGDLENLDKTNGVLDSEEAIILPSQDFAELPQPTSPKKKDRPRLHSKIGHPQPHSDGLPEAITSLIRASLLSSLKLNR